MAKASWLTVSPSSGSGNGTINNTADVYTGRNSRSTTVTVSANGVANQTYKVTQTGRPEQINFKNTTTGTAITTATITKAGQIKTIYISTNTAKLSLVAAALTDDADTEEIVEGGIAVEADTSNSSEANTTTDTGKALVWVSPATSLNTTNIFGNTATTAITGDPGASAQCNIPVRINIPFNDTVFDRTFKLIATANGGQVAQLLFTQSTGDARLVVSVTNINFPATTGNGEVVIKEFAITSNATWLASIADLNVAEDYSIYSLKSYTGSGDYTNAATLNENYYGKNARTLKSISISTAKKEVTKTISVTQSGYGESVTWEFDKNASQAISPGSASAEYTYPNKAAIITIYVISNADNFTVSSTTVSGVSGLTVAADTSKTSSAQTTDTAKALVWVGDDASTNYLGQKYTTGSNELAYYPVRLNIPLNDTVNERSFALSVVGADGATAQVVIKQSAGEARLAVSPTEITLDYIGTAKSVSITSNTSWTVS